MSGTKPRIVSYTSEELDAMRARGEDKTDWERVRNMTQDEADRNAEDDDPPTDEELANAVVVVRGRPVSTNPKKQVTLRLSQEVLRHYKAGGKGWQSRIDADLLRIAKRG